MTEGFSIRAIDPAILLAEAIAAHDAGRLEEAERLYRVVVRLAPGAASGHAHLGSLLLQTERWEEGAAALDRSLALNPDQQDMLSNRGAALVRLGRFEEAMASFLAAVALLPEPQRADSYNGLGVYLHGLGRLADAHDAYGRTLALNPLMVEGWCNQAINLAAAGRLDEALSSLDRALALNPGYADAYTTRGVALLQSDRLEEALAALDRALALKPDDAGIHNNRGLVLLGLGRLEEALACYGRAMILNPDLVDARWNAALGLLLKGDFEAGWPMFEWRWDRSDAPPKYGYPGAPWLGEAPIAGQILLIHAEQGFGDAIQMLRYAPMLAARGAGVVVAVHPALAGLAAETAGVSRVVSLEEPVVFNRHTPMMSLPLALGTRPETIPAQVPYLTAPAATARSWANRLERKTRRRIGLAWSGNADHKNDRNRSIPLEVLVTLLDADADFFSLQTDYRAGDAALMRADGRILDSAPHLHDFSDTAGLIQQMDLVIAVDTSVAHLAGALGRPVFILLPFSPDFRWHLHRSDSPWYPTARLFRQDARGDWKGVVKAVRAAMDRPR